MDKNVNFKIERGGGRRELKFLLLRQSGNTASNVVCLFLFPTIKLSKYIQLRYRFKVFKACVYLNLENWLN